MSKGSNRRDKHISQHEEDLRWEYLRATPKRKQEILDELQAMRVWGTPDTKFNRMDQ